VIQTPRSTRTQSPHALRFGHGGSGIMDHAVAGAGHGADCGGGLRYFGLPPVRGGRTSLSPSRFPIFCAGCSPGALCPGILPVLFGGTGQAYARGGSSTGRPGHRHNWGLTFGGHLRALGVAGAPVLITLFCARGFHGETRKTGAGNRLCCASLFLIWAADSTDSALRLHPQTATGRFAVPGIHPGAY